MSMAFRLRHDPSGPDRQGPRSELAGVESRSNSVKTFPGRSPRRIRRPRRSPSAQAQQRVSTTVRQRAFGPPDEAPWAKRRPPTPAPPCATRGRKETHPRACRKMKPRADDQPPSCGLDGSGRKAASCRGAAATLRPPQAGRGWQHAASARQRLSKRASQRPPEPGVPFRRLPMSRRGRTSPAGPVLRATSARWPSPPRSVGRS